MLWLWLSKTDQWLTPLRRGQRCHTQNIKGYLRVFFGDNGVIDTAVATIDGFEDENLCDFWAIFKKALTRVSGAYGKLFDKKTKGRKSCPTVPLNPSEFACFELMKMVSISYLWVVGSIYELWDTRLDF
jgi:hypothetical protein